MEEEEKPHIVITQEFLSKIIDVEEIIERIEAYLRGAILKRKEDGTFEIVKVKGAKPLMNETGIQEFLRLLRERIDVILFGLSHLDENFIANETFYFNVNLIEILAINSKRWEFNPKLYQETIDRTVDIVIASYRKGLYGLTLNKIFGAGIQQQEQKPWWKIW